MDHLTITVACFSKKTSTGPHVQTVQLPLRDLLLNKKRYSGNFSVLLATNQNN